jgi:hypothetical protein
MVQTHPLQPDGKAGAWYGLQGFGTPRLQQLAELDPGRTGGLTGPAAETKIELGRNLCGFQLPPRYCLHQINAAPW